MPITHYSFIASPLCNCDDCDRSAIEPCPFELEIYIYSLRLLIHIVLCTHCAVVHSKFDYSAEPYNFNGAMDSLVYDGAP